MVPLRPLLFLVTFHFSPKKFYDTRIHAESKEFPNMNVTVFFSSFRADADAAAVVVIWQAVHKQKRKKRRRRRKNQGINFMR